MNIQTNYDDTDIEEFNAGNKTFNIVIRKKLFEKGNKVDEE